VTLRGFDSADPTSSPANDLPTSVGSAGAESGAVGATGPGQNYSVPSSELLNLLAQLAALPAEQWAALARLLAPVATEPQRTDNGGPAPHALDDRLPPVYEKLAGRQG
jgi:hypothetical protein